MRFAFSIRWASFLLFAGLSLILIAGAAAQPPIKENLKKAYNEIDARRRELNNGNVEAKKADKAVADAVAEWHIYRAMIKFEKIDLVQIEFNNEIASVMDKKNATTKRAYIDLLGAACAAKMKDVLEQADLKIEPSTVIYAAQMMPTMAKLKQENVSNLLVSLIEDPKTHDVVRLHALKALKETMPVRIQKDVIPLGEDDLKSNDQNAKRKHDSKNVDTLTKYINRPINVQNMDADAIATMKFLRREAIVSLAAAGAPAVHARAKPKIEEGLVAPTLMKVLAKGAMQPPASLAEKIEAAAGLCAMEYRYMPEYHAELGIYLVGQTVIEFVNQYNKDYINFGVFGKEKRVPYVGWKADGKRLRDGLGQLAANAKENPAAEKSAKELQAKAKRLLDRIVNDYQQTDAEFIEDLNRVVGQLRPKDGYTFKTIKTSAIPLD